MSKVRERVVMVKLFKRMLCVLAVLSLLPLAAWASGTTPIGTVTITNSRRVNVREGGALSYGIIASVAPDESYPCLSVARSGWYEILLPDGQRGFISNKLARIDYGPQQGDTTVPVYYRTADGKMLYTDRYRLNPGVNQIYANNSFVPKGYVLQSTQPVTVNNNNGIITPAAVLFIYSGRGGNVTPALPGGNTARVTVEYKDIYGSVLNTTYADLAPGTRMVYANAALLPAGYSLVGAKNAVVSVSSALVAMPSIVTFLAVRTQNQTPRPQNVTIPVHYQTMEGVRLYTDYVRLNIGSNTVYADDSRVPSGYMLYSGRSASVYVSDSGIASPSALTFLYRYNTPQNINSTVRVYYRSSSGETLATDRVRITRGNNTIYANDAKVPGYKLQSSRSVSVYLASNGVATPSSVVFTYTVPVSAAVQVIYRDNAGNGLYSEWVQLGLGTHTIYANNARAPQGYRLFGASSAVVNVSPDGAVVPSQIVFTYAPPDPQATPVPQAPSTPQPAAPSGRDYTMPMYAKGSISGAYDVYSGPGEGYYRSGNATVGGGVCRWYGTEGDYVLMGYQYTKGGYRLGYIPRSAIPDGVNVQELHFMYEPVEVLSAASLTDDPVIDPKWLFRIPAGTTVKLLGFLPDNDHWAYIETDYPGQTARGFINRIRIGR